MTTTNWEKFCLLMWKNWLLQIRHKVQTLTEIMVPIGFCGLLVLMRILVKTTVYENDFIFDELQMNNLTINVRKIDTLTKPTIIYSPTNPVYDQLMQYIAELTHLPVNGLSNSRALEKHMTDNQGFAGIEFKDHSSNITSIPNRLQFAIRFPGELRNNRYNPNPVLYNWRTDYLFPYYLGMGPRNFDINDGGIPAGYYSEGFIHLQQAIFIAFLRMKNVSSYALAQMPDIKLQRFPYPPFIDDVLMQGLGMVFSLIILLCFAYPCINIVKFVTTEKEKQFKEAMKIMGLPNWLHWTAWLVKCLLFLTVTVTCIVLLLTISWYPGTEVAVFGHSNPIVLWLFLFMYSLSTILFSFMLSVFFSKASTASAVAGMFWFISFIPFTFIAQRFESVSLLPHFFVSLFSNSAMAFGIDIILRREATAQGVQWLNLFEPVVAQESWHFGHVIVMLLVDSLLYLTVTLYVEQIFPGDHGVPQAWYFPFIKGFWYKAQGSLDAPEINCTKPLDTNFLEPDPVAKAGIAIIGLTKVYSGNREAVKSLTLNMFENQITVLLGHNGAGKTTTMSMLTGMLPPTAGTALINGKDIRTDIDQVRSSLGLCPQHNILFDELTVREHIEFYSRLKGMRSSAVETEVQKYVKTLQLDKQIDQKTKTLSGGIKRKLSVSVALCADSKVVFCDEPTSGVDPVARRAIWDLLLKEKKGRTILFSTHSMDEADVLGDRIAIMAGGGLQAVGSSFFLKKKFGGSTLLVCVKKDGCKIAHTTKLLQKYIPDISVKADVSGELSYQLKDENVGVFQAMLQDLEENALDLKLSSFGISPATIEEAFMNVGSDSIGCENVEDQTEVCSSNKLSGWALLLSQLMGLLKKHVYHTMRNWPLFLLQNLIPVVILLLTMSLVRSNRGYSDLPPFQIDLQQYNPSVTLLQSDKLIPQSLEFNITEKYRDAFTDVKEQQLINVKGDMIKYFLEVSRQSQAKVDSKYMVGASVAQENITAWFNNRPFHTAPISANLVHNAILQSVCGSDCRMDVTNKPMPFRLESEFYMLEASNNLGFQLAFNLGFGMSFVAALYVTVYIKERTTRAKLIQFISGVNAFSYWGVALAWDLLTFSVTSLITLTTLFVFQDPGWTTVQEFGRGFVIFLCLGWAVLPCLYLTSLVFTAPATGFIKMSIFFVFTGAAIFSILYTMLYEDFNLADAVGPAKRILTIIPFFAFSDALNNIHLMNVVNRVCENQCGLNRGCQSIRELCALEDFKKCCSDSSYFSYSNPGIGRHLIFMLIVGTLSLALLCVIELRLFKLLYFRKLNNKIAPQPVQKSDIDVETEAKCVHKIYRDDFRNHNLILKDITKFYKNFKAVNQLSIAVNAKECFGLLGINGAGKTTTFKMLIGDENISSGDAWVQGMSLRANQKQVHSRIGYCPQFDALIDDLTGRETLEFYCALRGIPRTNIEGVVKNLITDLNLTQHIDKLVKEYSGGNKRKLSTAVALVGDPAVIFLDEPTTGMDPGAKRHFWSVVNKLRSQGRSIVLTSHSMEECETLCTRLAIMVNGQFQCLGSVQYLKSKFSAAILLRIKVSATNDGNLSTDEKIKKFITVTFPLATLKEEFQSLLTYHIPKQDLKWSHIFGVMEKARSKMGIEDYSIGQTSLEQVFLSFAKYQKQ